MIETPARRSTRQKSRFPSADTVSDDGDSSSAAETTRPRSSRSTSVRRRGVGKFVENIDDSDVKPKEEEFSPVPEDTLASVLSNKADDFSPDVKQNGHTNQHTNGHTNGHVNGNGVPASKNFEVILPVAGTDTVEKMRDKNGVESNKMFDFRAKEI